MACGWIIHNKFATVLFVITIVLLAVSIFLGVERAAYEEDLNNCLEEKKELIELCNTSITSTSTVVVTSTTIASTDLPPDPINYRLPKHVVPFLYNLHLNPNLDTETFSGRNIISINVTERTNEIHLHSHGLVIDKIELRLRTEKVFDNTYEIILTQQFLKITLKEIIEVNDDYELDIEFHGDMKNRIVGLYSSNYVNETGGIRYIATSKFEPTYARQAFPCFDEPAMKAPFKISLVRPIGDGYSALSNMNEESHVDDLATGTAIVHFAKSVPMSTYLSCFIVSDFLSKNRPINANGIGTNFEMRVFATPAQLNKVDFALNTGVKVIEHYIDYFQVPYPLPKLDMAAIPDFVSGAMEHWGLVTFRETALLYDSSISSTSNKQRVATVVAHELAHMWFGNLVTMAWWNELWLNEGFASYIECKGTDAVYPEWKMVDQFLVDKLHGVLSLDATLASHPIVQTVENPDQITEIFDSITYSKGASVIRMLEDFVGPNNFQKSVTNYLIAHQYGNAVTDDLLNEIENLNLDIDVKYIMSTWTKQSGFPVVNVEAISNTEYKLTQKRFFSNPENELIELNDSEFNYRWYIPISYYTDISAPQRTWFKNLDNEVRITVPVNHKWLKLNKDQIGYYRVNYPTNMWHSFTAALIENVNVLSISDRAHLLNDAFNLADATQLEYAIALDLTTYLANENDYVPWAVAADKLLSLKNLLYYTDQFPKLLKYGESLVSAVYERVGWNVDEDHLKNHLRTTVLGLACSMDIYKCLNEANNQFNTWLLEPTKRPSPDVRGLVYYYGMASVRNFDTWNKVWELFIAEQDAQEKIKLMNGLAGIQVPWILQRYVNLAWDEKYVKGQDYFSCLQNIAANPVGESIVWNYVRENWENLVARFGLNERYLGSMIPSITGRFASNIQLQEVQDFFTKYPEAGAGAAARKRTIENIQTKIKWLENNEQKLGAWLDTNYSV